MVQPLQIDSYLRDYWQEFDALALAQLASVAYDKCYKPKIIVGLNTEAQTVPAQGYADAVVRIRPGSLLYGFYMSGYDPTFPVFNFQLRDLELGRDLYSEPVSNLFFVNPHQTLNYPTLLPSPYASVGKGQFKVEVWNQTAAPVVIIPLIGILEVQ